MKKIKGGHLWRLQRGNPVNWHDGHLSGTAKVVKPYHETTYTYGDRTFKGLPDGFYVTDDAGSFVNKLFYLKDLTANRKDK